MLDHEVAFLIGFLCGSQLLNRIDLLAYPIKFLFELLNDFGILCLLNFLFKFVSLLLESFELASDIVLLLFLFRSHLLLFR